MDKARSEISDYIECFYNSKFNHGSNDGLSPVKFEKQFYEELELV